MKFYKNLHLLENGLTSLAAVIRKPSCVVADDEFAAGSDVALLDNPPIRQKPYHSECTWFGIYWHVDPHFVSLTEKAS